MSNTIIVCLDGTWNGPGQQNDKKVATPSNVQKLYERLAGTQLLQADKCESETTYHLPGVNADQVAKYIHGVGDSSNLLTRYAEGSTGAGLLARLTRGYTFISRNYTPGDQVIIVGFSRGAYTARALGGLIVNQGLLDWKQMRLGDVSDAAAYSAAMTAWSDYRQGHGGKSMSFIGRIDDLVNSAKAAILSNNQQPTPKYVKNVPIKAIAVWDTVGALGVPLFMDQDGSRPDLFEFNDSALSNQVEFGFHAIAADEERVDFSPTLWDSRANVIQTLFPGAHADVGGGYPSGQLESGLSDGALVWMIRKLAPFVAFKPFDDIIPDCTGVSHQPWLDIPYRVRPQGPRLFPAALGISQLLADRLAEEQVTVEGARNARYRPTGLRPHYLDDNWKLHTNVELL